MKRGIARRYRWGIHALLLLVLFGSFSSLYAQTGAQPIDPAQNAIVYSQPGEIVEVKFIGNHNISDAELSGVVQTHKRDWINKILYGMTFHLFGEPPQYTDPVILEQDTSSIVAYYKDNGFISARATYTINPQMQTLQEFMKVQRRNQSLPRANQLPQPDIKDSVIFYIEEGTPSDVSGVAFEGLENLPLEFQPELTEHTTIKLNTRYSRRVVEGEVDRLRNILEENGYPYFSYDSVVVERDRRTNNVHVLMYFRPGPRYKYGNVRIVIDTASEEKKLVDEDVVKAQLVFEKGHWYKASEMLRSEQKLAQLGTFDIARITLDTAAVHNIPDSLQDSLEVPVIVFLRMRLRHEITPGIFAGSGVEGITAGVTAGYNNHNLTGRAEDFSASLSAQPFPSTEPRYTANVDFRSPYFFHTPDMPLLASASFSYLQRKDKLLQRLFNGRLGTTYPIGNELDRRIASFEVAGEYVETKFFDPSLIELFRRDERLTSPHFNLIATASAQQDHTDNLFDPSKGDWINLLVEYSSPALGNLLDLPSAHYTKGVVHAKKYYDLSVNATSILAGRVRVGYTYLVNDLRDAVPYDRRLYAGGPNSVRGWGAKELIVSYFQGNQPITLVGGFKSLEFNLEWRWAPYQYPIAITTMQKFVNNIRVVPFLDGGQAWDYDIPLRLRNIGLAIGAGLRYNTFFGPLRFDWGFKLYDPNPNLHITGRSAAPESGGLWLWERPIDRHSWAVAFGIGHAF